jgi:hypothetical protein
MYKIYVCIISLLILAAPASAQQDSLFLEDLRIGFDLVPLLEQFIGDETNGFELALDLDLADHYQLVLEGGYSKYQYSQYNYEYQTAGSFLRLGFDKNLLKPEVNPGRDYLFAGLRLGVSWFSHAATQITVPSYWGEQSATTPEVTEIMPFVEATGGIRTEVLKNIYLGWNARMGFNLRKLRKFEVVPAYIPGLGQADKGINIGFHYYIAYRIPLK